MQLKRVAEAKLPTPWGDFLMVGFEETGNRTGSCRAGIWRYIRAVAGPRPRTFRVFDGRCLFSLRCDCGFQLEALCRISLKKVGDLLYHRQEGRNIGLLNKIRAYALQDQGYDTVEANHQLGFAADERDFTLCADMFKLLNVEQVRLLTNNPKKVEILTEAGINIVERVPLIVGRNPKNAHYLDTKAAKMGHLLNSKPTE
ncbi:GTP cyclohydrolase II [Klebsiella pneumoniae]|uniref:GTP cyclohydrolase-2 n=1 Tax=Klebsiella pneumoniae TaxID=573 RepID=A0A4P0Y3Z2_KLEPN|nr:GTP cyclohydrolase II [Klebsiella pneumoniae]